MRALATTLLLGAGLGAAACATPVGMYGHKPAELWLLPAGPAEVQVPRSTYAGDPLVMKRFENASLVPVGAHFIGAEPASQSMSQSYAPAGDLAPALFEVTYSSLRASGFPVWKDYLPSAEIRRGPPGAAAFAVVHGVVEELEISTFQDKELDDAARAKIAFVTYDQQGNKKKSFTVESKARIRRGSGDILEALGQRVAKDMAEVLNAGL